MTTPLSLTTGRTADGRQTLTVAGEIDVSNAAAFATALSEASAETPPLVVDLTAVEYLDSAGLAALFDHADHIELVAPALLEPVLTISGLASLVTIRH
ncbi:anti-sigma-factor antagonist [Kribbella flavida DSM 17836]|uniref:Anti-sigma-factor antagonist n=1 Tax=Kribbella flavida (strain DSM 17836 / JCM 10339 / NBRC 14399) TaxID=479435 RepID=D2PWL7_KRIFD|nr:STAS domain-containing protein [Kribbella flavida]ADB33486.1 anti-sigma-factor antagonist [Kribbella flavida DSM 17836]